MSPSAPGGAGWAPGGAAQPDVRFLGHPLGLFWISFTEFFERFSYYGMQSLLVLYLTHELLLPGHVEKVVGFDAFEGLLKDLYGPLTPAALASAVFGAYTACVWVAPILGGLLADRVIGRTPAIVGGALLMAAGHVLMAFEASFLLALLLILLGLGGFKGNLASQVGGLYPPGDARAASGFQIYTLSIQLAVIVTPLICGTLGEVYGWRFGFAAAGVGMATGALVYLIGRSRFPPDERTLRAAAGAPRRLSRRDWTKIIALCALVPVLGLIQVPSLQTANAYVIWAQRGVDLRLFGQPFPVTWLQTLDGVGTSVSILISLAFWRWRSKRAPEPDDVTKMVIGTGFFVAAPLILAIAAAQTAATRQPASLLYCFAYELIQNLGWVQVFAVATALYSRAAPPGVRGAMVGVLYLSVFVGSLVIGKLGGYLDVLTPLNFWLLHAAVTGAGGAVFIAFRRRLSRLFAEDAPASSAPTSGAQAL